MGRIIWLASYPKSGNTWMRAFLHNILRDPPEGYDINKISDFSVSDSTLNLYQLFIKKPWQEWTNQDIADVRWQAQRYICTHRQDDTFVKTHNALIEYLGKPIIYPEFTAGAIYIVRNPLDVCVSLAHHYSCSIDEAIVIMNNPTTGTVTNERLIYEYHGSWSDHVQSWTRTVVPGMLVVRYEDMLERPRETFGKVMRLLGLKPTPDRLARAIRNSSFEKLRSQEDKQGFREKPENANKFFRAGKSGQWRAVLSAEQVERLVGCHKEQMKRFGYWPVK